MADPRKSVDRVVILETDSGHNFPKAFSEESFENRNVETEMSCRRPPHHLARSVDDSNVLRWWPWTTSFF